MTRTSAIYNLAANMLGDAREEYELYLEAHYSAALEDTRGELLNQRGHARGVTSWELFRGPGVFAKAHAYASEELLEFWDRRPRMTFEQFEAAWLVGNYRGGAHTPAVFLSRKEFAARIGVKPDSLARYHLPEPDVTVGDTRGWLPETVDAWQASRGVA